MGKKDHVPEEMEDRVSSEKAKAVIFDSAAQERLDKVYAVIEHPDQFANTFIAAATSQSKIQEHIRQEVVTSLTTDPKSIEALKCLIDKQLKDDWKTFIKSTGGKVAAALWTLATLVIGAWLGHIWK